MMTYRLSCCCVADRLGARYLDGIRGGHVVELCEGLGEMAGL